MKIEVDELNSVSHQPNHIHDTDIKTEGDVSDAYKEIQQQENNPTRSKNRQTFLIRRCV